MELYQVWLPPQNKNCWSFWNSEIFGCFFFCFFFLSILNDYNVLKPLFSFTWTMLFSKLIPTILSMSIYNFCMTTIFKCRQCGTKSDATFQVGLHNKQCYAYFVCYTLTTDKHQFFPFITTYAISAYHH